MPLIKAPDLFTPPPVKYNLRPYQRQAADAAVAFLKSKHKRNGIIVAPTGCGKSLIIAEIAHQLQKPVVIFQPNKEILEQNYEKLMSYQIPNVKIFSASLGSKKIGQITLATIGSAYNRMTAFSQFEYSIVDECHEINPSAGMYKTFFDRIGTKVLGLTATPYRLGNNSYGAIVKFLTRCSPRVFHDVVHLIQLQELAAQGFMCPMKYYPIKGFDSNSLIVNSVGSGYTDESIKRYYKEIMFENKLMAALKRLLEINRKNILVFTKFVDEAQFVVDALNVFFGPGTAAIVTGETDKKERAEMIRKYKAGEIKVIANVGVLTTGFDFPSLETIVIARPTKSLALWYQMVGRGIRPDPLNKDKQCWVIDMCDNYRFFGEVQDMRIEQDERGLYRVMNKGVQLTNVYF